MYFEDTFVLDASLKNSEQPSSNVLTMNSDWNSQWGNKIVAN